MLNSRSKQFDYNRQVMRLKMYVQLILDISTNLIPLQSFPVITERRKHACPTNHCHSYCKNPQTIHYPHNLAPIIHSLYLG